MTDQENIDTAGLGAPHAPQKDPMKAMRGIMAGTLILEALVVFLVLTVILRIDPDQNFTPAKIAFVVGLGTAMIVACGFQGRPWAIPLNIALQVALIAGFWVHSSMGVMGIFFALVWAYILYVRGVVARRLAAGLLPSQHD